MGEELSMRITHDKSERGFVLATALVVLSLLSLMAIAMYFTGRASIHVSSGAQHNTEGHYFAETAVNYMLWATRNDAEFDSFDYGGGGPLFVIPTDDPSNGDWTELTANLTEPGPSTISDSGAGVSGQVMYFDNTPLAEREARGAIVWPLPISSGEPVYPTLYNISASLPRYIRLDIDSAGNVTPAIPALPHANPPGIGTDIPNNGAIVWLTTGNSDMDLELAAVSLCNAVPAPPGAVACGVDSLNTAPRWLLVTGVLANKEDQHGVVVYAIGYVGGRPSSIIRAQIK